MVHPNIVDTNPTAGQTGSDATFKLVVNCSVEQWEEDNSDQRHCAAAAWGGSSLAMAFMPTYKFGSKMCSSLVIRFRLVKASVLLRHFQMRYQGPKGFYEDNIRMCRDAEGLFFILYIKWLRPLVENQWWSLLDDV